MAAVALYLRDKIISPAIVRSDAHSAAPRALGFEEQLTED
jgi:hypothetical protein